MAMNWIRGLRRIAWVLTLPSVAVGVFTFKGYLVESRYSPKQIPSPPASASTTYRVYAVGSSGYLYVRPGVPEETLEKLAAGIFQQISSNAKPQVNEPWLREVLLPPSGRQVYFNDDLYSLGLEPLDSVALEDSYLDSLQRVESRVQLKFYRVDEVRRFDPRKSLSLGIGTLVGWILVSQGSISMAAWIIKGFHGVSEND